MCICARTFLCAFQNECSENLSIAQLGRAYDGLARAARSHNNFIRSCALQRVYEIQSAHSLAIKDKNINSNKLEHIFQRFFLLLFAHLLTSSTDALLGIFVFNFLLGHTNKKNCRYHIVPYTTLIYMRIEGPFGDISLVMRASHQPVAV